MTDTNPHATRLDVPSAEDLERYMRATRVAGTALGIAEHVTDGIAATRVRDAYVLAYARLTAFPHDSDSDLADATAQSLAELSALGRSPLH